MAVSVELPGMFDLQAAKEQQRHKTGYEAAQIPLGRVPIYASSVGGDIYNEGLMGLAGMLGGTPDPAVAKQQKVAEIMERFPNPETSEDMMKVYHALNAAGIYDFAGQIFNMATALRNQETNLLNAQKTTATKPDYNQQARAYVSTIVSSSNWVDSLENWQELLANMEKIGYTGTDPHDTIQKKITAEVKSRDERDKLVHGDIGKLGEKWSASGMSDLQGRLESLEDLVELHTQPLIINGEQAYDKTGFALRTGDLPGVSFKNRIMKFGLNEAGDQARDFLGKLSSVVNSRLKTLSGSQVTQQEWERLQNEYQTGIATSEQLIKWIFDVRKNLEQSKRDMYATYDQEASIIFQLRQGFIPRLTDPSHIKYIPIGRYYYDINGNLRKREK